MFSDDKRGGTAPTPTPTHQGLFAHDESTRPRTHDTSASDLVDLNLALRAQFHRKKESSFVQPHISEAFDEWAAFKPCLLYTSPSPRDGLLSRMPSSA